MHGELGIGLPELSVIGLLDDYPTRSGYVITPVVLWGGADPEMKPNPAEAWYVHRVAFSELCRSASQRSVAIHESDRPVAKVPTSRATKHGATRGVVQHASRPHKDGNRRTH